MASHNTVQDQEVIFKKMHLNYVVLKIFIFWSILGAQPQYGNGGGGGQAQYGGGGQQAQYGGNGGRASQPQYGGGGDDNIAMLEKAVPGVPGQDYPIYAEVPDTVFSCDGQVDGGYYADPEAECQVFHICTNDGQGGLSKYSFLCPNGTIFNQEYFICDWWFNFDCSEAEGLYSLNEDIAAEREAATQALLNAAASNGQPTYVSSSSNSYSAPSQASSGGYNAPAGGGGRRQNGGGRRKNNGKRKNNGGRKKAAASNGYSAPSSSANAGYGAPANNNYGAPTSQAASAYGAPANNNYGAPANNNYGAPANNNYGAPDYDDLPSYGKRK